MAKRFEQAKKYTEKYKGKLHPCKYCGNTDIKIASDRSVFGKSQNLWFVACSTPKCDCTDSFPCVKDAVKSWNDKH